VTHRSLRLAIQPGLGTRLHDQCHYAATKLIIGGVDLCTMSGRIGHAGGEQPRCGSLHFLAAADRQAAEVSRRRLDDPPK
jgi:integrase